MAYQDSGLLQLLGELSAKTVRGRFNGPNALNMNGTSSMSVSAISTGVSQKIEMSGTGSVVAAGCLFQNAYVSMYGYLTAEFKADNFEACYDLNLNFETDILVVSGCRGGLEMETLTRYSGDTYPVVVRIAKDCNPSIGGYTFEMYTQLSGRTVYTASGTITDADNGIVEFPLATAAIENAGDGRYHIRGNDGSYITTFAQGDLVLLDDLI